ncbi:hypothetical protein L6452_19918 [Arctium lappa]|uniref:Uncharacterized protein n=1 Tax=Arctium lappa TaxID=4217 RepID=A0ACB9B9H6_ARCLA|nr:hypothetical protein L6452_19918 [Arctium lappa]
MWKKDAHSSVLFTRAKINVSYALVALGSYVQPHSHIFRNHKVHYREYNAMMSHLRGDFCKRIDWYICEDEIEITVDGSLLLLAMNVHSLFAHIVKNIKEEKEIKLALNARADTSDLEVSIMLSC